MTPTQEKLASKLNQIQIDTVLGVIAGKSQRQAYIDAGGKGSTPEAIDASASKLLSLDKVQLFKAALLESVVSDAIMTRQQALERLTLMASTEITDILEFGTVEVKLPGKDGEDETVEETIWRMKDSPEVERRAKASIKSVTMTKYGPKIEMYDSASAIAQMAKMQGWESAQKHIHGGDPANPVVTTVMDAEAYKQARKEMLDADDC